MSDRLSDELLRLVLNAFANPVFDWDGHAARKRTLCALCRTSRRFRRLAQPLLYRHIRVHCLQLGRLLNASTPALRASTAILELDCDICPPPELYEAVRRVKAFPRLVDLRVEASCCPWPLNLADLSGLTSLRRLSLDYSGFTAGALPDLPALEVVHFAGAVHSSAQHITRWLVRALLPSLKVVHLDMRDNRAPELPALDAAMLAQLDFVQVRTTDDDLVDLYEDLAHPTFLMNLDLPADEEAQAPWQLARHALVNLDIDPDDDLDEWKLFAIDGLRILSELLSDISFSSVYDANRPGTLILPWVFSPQNADMRRLEPRIAPLVAVLEEKCARPGVNKTVLFATHDDVARRGGEEEFPRDLVSLEFWAHLRRLRAARGV